jgi:hypothetical protein
MKRGYSYLSTGPIATKSYFIFLRVWSVGKSIGSNAIYKEMVSQKPAKKTDSELFNDAVSKQWNDTSAERVKREADGNAEYDKIIEKKRKMDEQEV